MLRYLIIVALEQFRAIEAVLLRTKMKCGKGICWLLLAYTSSCWSTPWIDSGDALTRHHLQYLRDTGIISLSLSTWPVSWSDVNYALDDVLLDSLDEAQLWSYHYLKHELNQAKRQIKTTKTLHLSNAALPFSHFATKSREKISLESKTSFINNRFALTVSAQVVEDEQNDNELDLKLDGTFAAVTLGNWIVGAGAVDRWWGPGWQSSLILSNNARPSPGIFIKRKTAILSQSNLSAWLGNWTFDAFTNSLENDYESSKPKLLGGRFGITPLPFLELAYSRVGLWGGHGRIENTDGFSDFILSDDTYLQRTTENDSAIVEIESNQLESYDARLSGKLRAISLALYGQYLKNERLNNANAESAYLFGAESAFSFGATHNRFAIEYSDTENAVRNDNSVNGNAVYEHPYYSHGYRYHGRTLGESVGSNAKKLSMLGEHYIANGHQVSWRITDVQANKYLSSNNMYGGNAINHTLVQIQYTFPLNSIAMTTFGLFTLDKDLFLETKEINSGAYFELTFRI